jgi:hypothetical protein
MQNVVMHLDMNNFFASCEQQDNFSWRGRRYWRQAKFSAIPSALGGLRN